MENPIKMDDLGVFPSFLDHMTPAFFLWIEQICQVVPQTEANLQKIPRWENRWFGLVIRRFLTGDHLNFWDFLEVFLPKIEGRVNWRQPKIRGQNLRVFDIKQRGTRAFDIL